MQCYAADRRLEQSYCLHVNSIVKLEKKSLSGEGCQTGLLSAEIVIPSPYSFSQLHTTIF